MKDLFTYYVHEGPLQIKYVHSLEIICYFEINVTRLHCTYMAKKKTIKNKAEFMIQPLSLKFTLKQGNYNHFTKFILPTHFEKIL
jgi:hypothetical protein